VGNIADGKSKSKKPFESYKTPAWLALPQLFMCDLDRKVLAVLCRFADQRTGQLRVPRREHTRSRGWVTGKQIDAAAKIGPDTRMKSIQRLQALGFADYERGRAIYSKGGRCWDGRGPTEYSVDWVILKNFNPHAASSKVPEKQETENTKDSAPGKTVELEISKPGMAASTPDYGEIMNPEPQACVPSTLGNLENKNGNNETDSSRLALVYPRRKRVSKDSQTTPIGDWAASFLTGRLVIDTAPNPTPVPTPTCNRIGGSLSGGPQERTPPPDPCPDCGSLALCSHKKAERGRIWQTMRERVFADSPPPPPAPDLEERRALLRAQADTLRLRGLPPYIENVAAVSVSVHT
jgi:hypothetical protein